MPTHPQIFHLEVEVLHNQFQFSQYQYRKNHKMFSYEYIGHQNAIYTVDNKTETIHSDISILPADSTLLSYSKLSSFLFEQYPSLKNNRLFPTS